MWVKSNQSNIDSTDDRHDHIAIVRARVCDLILGRQESSGKRDRKGHRTPDATEAKHEERRDDDSSQHQFVWRLN